KSEIGGHPVIQQPMRQWMLKITDYAESLLNGLNDLDWPESVKDLQRNWIGKSEGANIHFNLPSINQAITIYTTRPDTLFGATYMVLAPEHPLVEKLVSSGQKSAVISYTEASQKKSDMDRGELNKEKTGVPLDAYAINPVNGEEVPIWVADYVLMSYGTGAIMAVPGHDQRDYEFAKEYDLPIVEVVSGGDITENAYTDNIDGLLINSSNDDGLDLNGQKVANAIQSTIEWLKRSEKGEATIQYKLRDWLFSRQRYWGEPIPVVHKADGSIIAINESDLPLTLPQVEKYEPAGTGESPLANIDDWVNAPEGKRETNTMPQWAGSCWYYLRFVDPLNEAQSWSKEAESYWMPVDLYVGGVEHAVLHLLYSRFWHHVLHDLGLVSTREPFQKLFNQGMIQGEDGQKMSKSRGNVVNPDDVVGEFGADSFRLYEMFMGPLEKSKPWSTTGLQGCYRFVQKVWKLFTEDSSRIQENCASDETIKILHQSIKKVTEDLSDLRFNTSVSQLMIFVNHLTKLEKLDKFVLHQFLLILNPFAPHLSEELNQMLGYKIITNSDWPIYDKTKILEDKIEIAIQFNGKTRGKIHIANEESQIGIELSIKNDPKLSKYLYEKTIIKVIYIKNRIINFVLR
ncbi:MAG: leucine--tRNA ligase, partial [Candidatus Marinimicrobia bacterium]|nr:leucine--tRNA ligase [Candidatus Neomarinimicrobiota bacterium]